MTHLVYEIANNLWPPDEGPVTQAPNVEMLESEIVGSSAHNQLSKTVWSLSH
jgi:hypothetical protein